MRSSCTTHWAFPIDLTREDRRRTGRTVDIDDFERRMAQQRPRARAAGRRSRRRRRRQFRVAFTARGVRRVGVHRRQEHLTKANVVALVVDGRESTT